LENLGVIGRIIENWFSRGFGLDWVDLAKG
jgi:hypothetical protein